jgi:energy-coupling factor transport system substrate-specific component
VKTNNLQIKDLVITGIFTAIYFGVNFAVMLCSGIAPIVWLIMPLILGIICGVIFMLLTAKVRKAGPVLIMGLITALVYMATGQLTVVLLITYAVGSIIAELIRRAFGYQSLLGNLIGYGFFSLGMMGSLLPIWLFQDSFFASIIAKGMDPAYVNQLKTITSGRVLTVLIVGTFGAALLGGLIGQLMLKKHFIRAGIVN